MQVISPFFCVFMCVRGVFRGFGDFISYLPPTNFFQKYALNPYMVRVYINKHVHAAIILKMSKILSFRLFSGVVCTWLIKAMYGLFGRIWTEGPSFGCIFTHRIHGMGIFAVLSVVFPLKRCKYSSLFFKYPP